MARCPIPNCTSERKPEQLMCRADWFRVPKDIRDRIWATVGTDAGAYLDARNEAIAAVVAKLDSKMDDKAKLKKALGLK